MNLPRTGEGEPLNADSANIIRAASSAQVRGGAHPFRAFIVEVPETRGMLKRVVFPLSVLAFFALFIYIFGFHIKGTRAYACSLSEARRNPAVIAELGEPLEAGLFAWTYGYIQEGSVTDTSFRTSLSGPKAKGTLRVRWYSSPVGSSLHMELDAGGRRRVVHNGSPRCR